MHRTDELVRNTSHRYRHMHRTNFTHSPDELVRNTSHRYRHMHRTNFTHLYNTHPAYAEKLLFLLLLWTSADTLIITGMSFSENFIITKPNSALHCQSFTLTSNISNIWHFAFITSAFDPQTFTCGSENQDNCIL